MRKCTGVTMRNASLMLVYLLLASLVISVSVKVEAKEKPKKASKLLQQFDRLVQGEFDNYNQVNFEQNDFLADEDKPKDKHARLYKRVSRIHAPKLGAHVYYHQIHSGGKDKGIYRKSLEVVTIDDKSLVIRAENYRFKTPDKYQNLWLEQDVSTLSLEDLRQVGQNCFTEYKLLGNSFVGAIEKSRCKVESKKFGHLNLRTEQVVSEDEIWHLEEGFLPSGKILFGREDDEPIKLRRAKSFSCWAAFKTEKVKTNGEAVWDFFPDLTIHNQGDIAEFTTSDMQPKHYFIRLKETVFPAGNRPDVFELFVHERVTDDDSTRTKKDIATIRYQDALSYTWTNTAATRLGINLRWMQASCHIQQ